MPKLRTGISQVGGKFRLCNTILDYIPYHEFFLSMFCGACWVEINKPRTRYECFNDLDSEIINYLVMTREYPDEFDAMKQGVMGLVSQEICNRIVRGDMKPKDDLERSYYFYYLNKLTFGGDVKKVGNNNKEHAHYCGLASSKGMEYDMNQKDIQNAKEEHAHWCGIMRPTDPCRQPQVEKIKNEWNTKVYFGISKGSNVSNKTIEEVKQEYKTKGFAGIINPRAIPQNTLHDKDFENIKKEWKTKGYKGLIDNQTMSKEGYGRVDSKVVENAKQEYKEKTSTFRGIILPTVCKDNSIEKAKVNYRGITPKNINYAGINVTGATGWSTESGQVEKAKKQYQAVSYKGINPKTTRPYQNNDCGLLTPLDRKAIERLRYVNITCYSFDRVYELFYKAFHERKGLNRECFIYADPPYPGTEKYYGDKFTNEMHQQLIDLMLKTPFNFMLSIGGECDMYLEQLKDWVIVPVKVRYSTDATSQKKSQEYIIMNYEINDIGNMTQDHQKGITSFF